jgi:hypothetical protein
MQQTWAQTQESIKTMLERITAISGGNGNIEVYTAIFPAYYGVRSFTFLTLRLFNLFR